MLKQFQLLWGVWQFFFVFSVIQFHHSELFIRYSHDADMPPWRKDFFYALNMYVGIFAAAAMAQVNGKLEHSKAIIHNILTKFGIYLPVLFGFGRQVKKN